MMRVLTDGDGWNAEGIRSSMSASDIEVKCSVTDTPIFIIRDGGDITPLSAFGCCVTCGKNFHESAMRISEGTDKCKYPVIYIGLSCKTCWQNDVGTYNENNI
jgi:hypothetical protein